MGSVALNGTSAASTVDIATGTMTLGSGDRLLDTAAVTVDGSLILGGDEEIGSLSGTGSVSVQLGTLTVNSGTFSGVISGTNSSYGLTKISDGTLTLSGSNTFIGSTQVSAGTLTLTGSLASETIDVAVGATFNDVDGGMTSSRRIDKQWHFQP